MRCKNWNEGLKQAKANANFFAAPYVVFYDTSGNVRCEKYSTQVIEGAACVVEPDLTKEAA